MDDFIVPRFAKDRKTTAAIHGGRLGPSFRHLGRLSCLLAPHSFSLHACHSLSSQAIRHVSSFRRFNYLASSFGGQSARSKSHGTCSPLSIPLSPQVSLDIDTRIPPNLPWLQSQHLSLAFGLSDVRSTTITTLRCHLQPVISAQRTPRHVCGGKGWRYENAGVEWVWQSFENGRCE